MTKPESPAAPKSRIFFRWATAIIAVAWLVAIVSAVLGVRGAWPSWLMLAAASGMVASFPVRQTRPRAAEYLMLAMSVLSLAAVIGLIVRSLR